MKAILLAVGMWSTLTSAHPNLNWQLNLPSGIRGDITVSDDLAYVGTLSGELYAIDINKATIVWQQTLTGQISSGSVSYRDSIFIQTQSGFLYQIDRTTGEIIWHEKSTATIPSPNIWDSFITEPLIIDESLYHMTELGILAKRDIASKSIVWQYQLPSVSRAPMIADANYLYISDMFGHILKIDSQTGKERWRYTHDGTIDAAPYIVGDLVVFGSRSAEVVAIDAENGEKVWSVSHGSSFSNNQPNSLDSNLYTSTLDAQFFQSIDIETGKENWRIANSGHVYSQPTITHDQIIFSWGDGYRADNPGGLVSLDKDGQVQWEFDSGSVFNQARYVDGDLLFGDEQGQIFSLKIHQ